MIGIVIRFEKMISGHYLGELARLIMVQLTKDGLLFNGLKGSNQLYTSELFLPEYLYLIEEDQPGNYMNCREVLSKIGLCVLIISNVLLR